MAVWRHRGIFGSVLKACGLGFTVYRVPGTGPGGLGCKSLGYVAGCGA